MLLYVIPVDINISTTNTNTITIAFTTSKLETRSWTPGLGAISVIHCDNVTSL